MKFSRQAAACRSLKTRHGALKGCPPLWQTDGRTDGYEWRQRHSGRLTLADVTWFHRRNDSTAVNRCNAHRWVIQQWNHQMIHWLIDWQTGQKIWGHRVQSRLQYSPLNNQSSLPVYGLVPRVNHLKHNQTHITGYQPNKYTVRPQEMRYVLKLLRSWRPQEHTLRPSDEF